MRYPKVEMTFYLFKTREKTAATYLTSRYQSSTVLVAIIGHAAPLKHQGASGGERLTTNSGCRPATSAPASGRTSLALNPSNHPTTRQKGSLSPGFASPTLSLTLSSCVLFPARFDFSRSSRPPIITNPGYLVLLRRGAFVDNAPPSCR
jgi:hypothetical protein